MTGIQHQPFMPPARVLILGAAATLLCACAKTSPPDVVSCKVVNGSHGVCMEYVHPRSDLLRTSIVAQCREGGGVIVDACPVEDLVGSCDRATDPRLPTSLSERVRVKTYFQYGGLNPPDVERLQKQCSTGSGLWSQPGGAGG